MAPYWGMLDNVFRANPELLDKVGVVPMPHNRAQMTMSGSRFLIAWAESENLDVAKEFIAHQIAPEQAIRLTELSPQLYPPMTHEQTDLLRASDAPAVEAYGDLLFDVVYPQSAVALIDTTDTESIDRETCSLERSGIANPHTAVLHTGNHVSRAIQRVAYEDWSAEDAAAEAQERLSRDVQESVEGGGF